MRSFLGILAGLALPASLFCQTVRFATNLGDIDVTLLPESAPRTVENFLRYVNRGDYSNTFFHRSVRGFVIQGGGYRFVNNQVGPVREDAPILNEFRVSNTRGTIAMAKLGDNPHSATNQWFFNLGDNSRNLNTQNGGFTVFGRVANSESLAVMDRIAALPVYDAGAPFDSLPLRNYNGGNVTASNLALVTSITVLSSAAPAIAEGGIASAGSFGALPSAAPGSFIEIYGSNLAGTTRSWDTADFTDGQAPTSLEDITVTIDGKPAFVSYVSPTQVNVQVPADVPAGGTVPVVVQSGGQSSAPIQLEIRERAPGLLAPPAFKVGDRQYAAAVKADGSFVSNGEIPNVPAAPANPGETLVFYGIGFGAVTPSTPPGQIAQGTTALTSQVEFRFGDTPATVLYAGMTPDLVGLYQFNVVVPAGLTGGDIQVTVTVNGQPIEQTLYITVH